MSTVKKNGYYGHTLENKYLIVTYGSNSSERRFIKVKTGHLMAYFECVRSHSKPHYTQLAKTMLEIFFAAIIAQ